MFLKSKKQSKLKFNEENRTIEGINVIESGELKDWRGWQINDEFLNDLVAYANKQPDGILSNYGHNYNNLGKRLGRAKNFNIKKGKVHADLNIFESADITPGHENLGTYVASLSSEDDKAIMFSIHFDFEYFYQEVDNKKVKIWYYDDNDNWVSSNPEFGAIYPKFAKLNSVDVVDDGAATNSFFAVDEMGITFNEIIHSEGFEGFLQDNYKSFTPLNKFYELKTKKSYVEQAMEYLGFKKPDNQELTTESTSEDLTTELEQKGEKITGLETQLADAQSEIERLKQTITEQKATIQTLEEEPDGEHPADTGGAAGDDNKKLYHRSGLTAKAIAMYNK